MKSIRVGRCTIQVELNKKNILGPMSKLNGYDVVVFDTKEGKVIRDCINLMKFTEDEALECKMNEYEEVAKRYTLLKDAYDMACHNLMCYSTNLLMDTPKPEFANEWHRENTKVKTIESWLQDSYFNNEKWHGRA